VSKVAYRGGLANDMPSALYNPQNSQRAERRVAERRAVLARNGTILIDLAPAATSGLSSRCNSRQTVCRSNKAFV
jgi:hypothetical protein